MEYQWDFINDGVRKVREAGRSERAYVAALNPPELGNLVWQVDPALCEFPTDIKDAAEAIAALAASIETSGDGSWLVLRTIAELADWIKSEEASNEG